MFRLFGPSLEDIEKRLAGRPWGEAFGTTVARLNRLYSGDIR